MNQGIVHRSHHDLSLAMNFIDHEAAETAFGSEDKHRKLRLGGLLSAEHAA